MTIENREIYGVAKTIRELMKGVKYSIDYYQREYKWQDKQIIELIDDLSSKFLEEYDPSHERKKVSEYPYYFLGPIIISKKEGKNYIVDGQQRLTSLTLLFVLLRNLQKDRQETVFVDDLIYSELYGTKSFNMDVDERIECMEALFDGQVLDANEKPESIQNLIKRYHDLQTNMPEEILGEALPYFMDWLLENVQMVEITAYTDEDAYTIFETMNDRGLSLTSTDMLKGYLLANMSPDKRIWANEHWRDEIKKFHELGKEVASDFFKAWLRSQYATKIRERKKNAHPEDFDLIGTEFHQWLRKTSNKIGLNNNEDFFQFIKRDFTFYSNQYLRIMSASKVLLTGMEDIYYNAQYGFTLQPMLLLSPLKPSDDEQMIVRKMGLVAKYLNILLTWRLWNFRLIAYSTMQYAMFLVMRDIRALPLDELNKTLYTKLMQEKETFDSNDRLKMHQQNRYMIHRILARLTEYIEIQSGLPSHYKDYVREGKNRFEVEHIWEDHPERFKDEFAHPSDFSDHRNLVGGLLLLPRSFNASYGDKPYCEKLEHYNTQNLLARSLHPLCYQNNPGFLNFIHATSLPFKPYDQFRKSDLEERCGLYRQIAESIWNPEDLLSG